MRELSEEEVHINRQFIDLGQAMRADDDAEVKRHLFNLGAQTLGYLVRCAIALERVADSLEPVKHEGAGDGAGR